MNVRAMAATILCDVMEGASLSDALSKRVMKWKDARDEALLQALCYGVCRGYFRLDAVLKKCLDNPIKPRDQDIDCLLRVGLYQLMDMRVPTHAAVAETVNAVRALKKPWAKGLVNAVLRHYLREAEIINREIEKDETAFYSHPGFMIDFTKKDWPDDWQAILTANNQHPPFSLRVNLAKITREKYLEKLTANGMIAQAIQETEAGITLTKPCEVADLPGFLQSEISVQDGAAQLAGELLDVKPGQRVLDACAAPGGKTTHILERTPRLQKLIAVDRDEKRLNRVSENLARLHLVADLVLADAGHINTWWDGVLFDRILLDAPCSASGVIRRHPDIKWLRRAADIPALAKEQGRLLTALWPTLKPGGLLVYVTCSVYALENARVVEAFLTTHPDARIEKIRATFGKECAVGRQILPGMHGMDGFYFACLRKYQEGVNNAY
ncbi:MAG TPA: 16S rRNA (cytosine(967)-C(5))-methyltransferase RsmB [Gammaproteobacteria bacterium]|nr:16S rRNA (cytosine(967)-C(5))-methyltransferase RsmB [Gammaproteobacteria bacterium]